MRCKVHAAKVQDEIFLFSTVLSTTENCCQPLLRPDVALSSAVCCVLCWGRMSVLLQGITITVTSCGPHYAKTVTIAELTQKSAFKNQYVRSFLLTPWLMMMLA